jgi:asparagine synthase (glutamine-hydrolysing)
MFAFALWDRRERRLLLARDRVGEKPLYYTENRDSLLFGSEPKAILQDPDVPRDVSYDALDSYLRFQYVPSPLSAFAALRKLPPAHTLVWESGKATLRRYWRLSFAKPQAAPDERELRELILERLLEATRLRLRSDRSVGAFLSGGVDSSAVVAAMARQTSHPVKTFSIGFDDPDYDETRYAEEVARALGTEHHQLRVEAGQTDLISKLAWHYGEPFADPSAIPSFAVAQLAGQHVTVALTGDGGDENFAGYPRYRTIMERPHTAGWERYPAWFAFFSDDQKEALYTPELRRELSAATAATLIRDPYLASDASTVSERFLDVDTQTYLPDDLLVKIDIATMAHSLEARAPLLDHPFMEMAAALPWDAKLSHSTTKRLFREALVEWLPESVLARKKMGFSVPLATWFRGALSDLPREILLDSRTTQRGLFVPAEVERMIDAHQQDRGLDYSNQMWALIQLEVWFRTYIDPSTPRAQNGL